MKNPAALMVEKVESGVESVTGRVQNTLQRNQFYSAKNLRRNAHEATQNAANTITADVLRTNKAGEMKTSTTTNKNNNKNNSNKGSGGDAKARDIRANIFAVYHASPGSSGGHAFDHKPKTKQTRDMGTNTETDEDRTDQVGIQQMCGRILALIGDQLEELYFDK